MYPPVLKAISKDIKERFKSYSIRKIGDLLSIGKSTIHRWFHETEIKKKKSTYSKHHNYDVIIKAIINRNPESRLKDIQDQIHKECNKLLSLSTICRYIRRFGISYKRTSFQLYNNLNELQAKRIEFQKAISSLDKQDIVSLDESYFYPRMFRGYGYSLKGTKCIANKKVNMKKYSLLLAISTNKVLTYEILSSNVNRVIFYDFLQNKLLPLCKGKTIIMDNVAFHKCKEIIKLIKANNTNILFIPPYSPEFNPIEMVFHIIKSRLRTLCSFTILEIETCLNIDENSLRNMYRHSSG